MKQRDLSERLRNPHGKKLTFDEWYTKNRDIERRHRHLNHAGDMYITHFDAMLQEVWNAAQENK